MSRRYYQRYNKRSRNYYRNDSPLDMLLEMLVTLVVLLVKLIWKVIYKLFNWIIDKFYEIQINKKVPVNISSEIQPLPKVDFKEQEEEKEVYLPYRKKSFLLTRAEYNFDKVLQEVVQDKYYIGRQVPLSSIIEVTSNYKPYRSKIDKKTIDFVLFNKAGYTPHLAIELDDNSHSRWDRIKRDEFVNDVLIKAGIKIVHIKTAYDYNLREITDAIEKVLF